jgi:hypothetical protein
LKRSRDLDYAFFLRELVFCVLNECFDEVGVCNDSLFGVATEHECKVCIHLFIFLFRLDALCHYLVLEAVVTTAFALRAMTSTLTFPFAWNIVLAAASEESKKVDVGHILGVVPDGDFHFDELVEFFGVAEVVGDHILVSVNDEAVARKCLQTQDLLVRVSVTVVLDCSDVSFVVFS